MIIYIDGKFYPEEEAKISVFDHGLLYGDGVFEGIRAYAGRVFKLEEHLARLEDSAKAILLKMPLSRDEIRKAVLETCQKNKMKSEFLSVDILFSGCWSSSTLIILYFTWFTYHTNFLTCQPMKFLAYIYNLCSYIFGQYCTFLSL